MPDWVLFVLLITGPGTLEVTAQRYVNADACRAQMVREWSEGRAAVCERSPSA